MNPLSVLMPGFAGTELPGWVEQRLRDGMAGVCLFATNVESPEQLRRLTDSIYAANPHAIVAIDEEGGDVTRLYQSVGSPFPGNAVLGRLDDEALTSAVAEQVGWELRAAGVNLTLAPDVDVNSNVHNPVIGVRSFGSEPDLVARHGAAWVRGLQATGVAANAKHFPGHGDAAQDSHVALPTIHVDSDTLHAREIVPFVAAVQAGVETVMSSHIMVPALDPHHPATFSSAILQGLLRTTVGFEGVVISDALDMVGASGEIGIPAAAARSLAAGCDLLCIGTENTDAQMSEIVTEVERAVTAGELGAARVVDASARISALAARLQARREQVPVPAVREYGTVPGLTLAKVAEAFHVSPAAREARAGAADAARPVRWIALESAANIAVGDAPWGPFAGSGLTADAVVTPDASLALPPDAAALTLVVGKDNHRHAWARELIDRLRPHGAIAIDMGWPDLDQPYADIATFGASRLVGDALRDWWT